MDNYSDLDLVVVLTHDGYESAFRERTEFAKGLGNLLSAFSGEHVGIPQILVCLYELPLLHVDIKFIPLHQFRECMDDPLILWEREQVLSADKSSFKPRPETLDRQWIEDRFWIWIHYLATKIGRGNCLKRWASFHF